MNKKFLSVILALILCLALVPAVFADSAKSIAYDQEGLFDEFDTDLINSKLSELSRIYGVDVAVVTTSSLDGKTAQEYADAFYEENGIGQGENMDGILLLISANERVWAISTTGSCIDTFTDYDIDYMSENFLPYLSDGDWSGAALSFIDDCGPCLSAADSNQDNSNDYSDDDDYYYTPSNRYFNYVWLVGSLIIGLIVALIVMHSMKKDMKSVAMKASASDYLRAGSFSLGRQNDLFLYNTVSMTAKPKRKDDDDRFGSGGFSSTHISGSGTTHGGRSGSF